MKKKTSYPPRNSEIEKELNLTKCPKCGYYNKNNFIMDYGKCNRCKTVLNKKADFRYSMIKKLHLFKKGQAGYRYRKDM